LGKVKAEIRQEKPRAFRNYRQTFYIDDDGRIQAEWDFEKGISGCTPLGLS